MAKAQKTKTSYLSTSAATTELLDKISRTTKLSWAKELAEDIRLSLKELKKLVSTSRFFSDWSTRDARDVRKAFGDKVTEAQANNFTSTLSPKIENLEQKREKLLKHITVQG